MAVLANFPMVSQLTTITSDNRPSEDAGWECVPASIGAAMLWYEGKHQWDQELNPDLLKDNVYGEAYRNDGTAAARYIPFCQSRGFKLSSLDGEPGYLVQQAHKYVQAQVPVIFTIPDPYCSAYQRDVLGWTHVCPWFEEGPGHLTAMDPYIARPIEKSDAEWASLLRFKQIWTVQRIAQQEETVIIDINNPEIKKHFKELNPHQWECTDTGGPWQGKIIQYALLGNYKSEGNKGLCGFDVLGRPMSNEIYINQNWVIQFYQFGVRQWKDQKVSPVALYEPGSPGVDPELAKLRQQLAQQPQTSQALVDAMNAIKAIVAKV